METQDLQELVDQVTTQPEPQPEPDGPEYGPGQCVGCGEKLSELPSRQHDGECETCFYSRLTVAQRCDMLESAVMPIACQWGEAETLAKLRDALASVLTLASSRDVRLVSQWSDGFYAGLVASRKLPANRGMSPESFAKLSEEWSTQPQLTGD